MITRIILSTVLSLYALLSFGQLPMDTVSMSVCSPKISNAYSFTHAKRMVVLLDGKEKIKDQMKVHDYLIERLDAPKPENLFLKLYKSNGKLFAEGEWNEIGFLNVVKYHQQGIVYRKALFNEGNFIEYQ